MTGIKHRDHKNLCNCFMRLLLLSVVYWIIQIHGKTGQKIPTKVFFVILSAFLLISPLLSWLNRKDIDHHRNYCQNITLTLVPRITEWEGDVPLEAKIQSPE